MAGRGEGIPSEDIAPLVRRVLEGEPDFVAQRREGGLCCYCHAGLGHEDAPPRLFAVAADGGLLLRLGAERRDRVVERGVAVPNAALPQWVLRPLEKERNMEKSSAERDVEVHGTPEEWVWLPVADVAAFERRRPHLIEALAYGRHLAAREENRAKRTE